MAVGRLLSYKNKEIKHDTGAGANLISEHFQDANQDSIPLPGDYLVTVSVPRTGGEVVVGFVDIKQEQKSKQGEYRVYARNDDGLEVVQSHLKNDGSVIVSNENGFYTLESNGDVNINGVVISATGAVESPVSFTAPSAIINNKELADHDHGPGSYKDAEQRPLSGVSGANN